MRNTETFTTALQNLATHKLRTALTMLGMIFGVGAVIAMLSIGAGGEKKALEAIGRLGLRNGAGCDHVLRVKWSCRRRTPRAQAPGV